MNSQIFNVECITSKANPTVVKISKLVNKKHRKEEELFTLDGVKLFFEAYKFGAEIKYVILSNEALIFEEIIEKIKLLKSRGTQVLCVSDAVFSKLTEELAPQGIITVCRFLKIHNYTNKIENAGEEKIMAFESIRDPGNLGTIVRNAAAFGIDRIVLSSDCVDIYSQKVLRATMGAIFKVKIDIASDFCGALKTLKEQNRRVISTTLGENSLKLGSCDINRNDVFVVGNEGHGISENVISLSDETLFIPMKENTESLNAAIAAAILMWEFFII